MHFWQEYNRSDLSFFGTSYQGNIILLLTYHLVKVVVWVELYTPKQIHWSSTPKPVKVTFFENRIFADIIKLVHTRLECVLNPITYVLIERKFKDTKGEGNIMTEAATGVICLSQRTPRIDNKYQKLGRGKEGFPCRFLRPRPWFKTSGLQNSEK